MRGWVIAIGITTGCFSPTVAPGLPCSENGTCPEGQRCVSATCLPITDGDASLDPDAAIDAMIDACPAAVCVNDDLVGCGAPVTCATGCSEDGGAHCRQLVPSLGLTPALLTGVTADVTGNDWDFNTEDGQVRRGNIILRVAGPGVIAGIGFEVIDGMGVFTANSFVVGTTDDFKGNGDNTLVLYSATTIEVLGEVDVGGDTGAGGPGGSDASSFMSGLNCRGRAGRFFAAGFGEGGGGGGGRTAGGNGGASNQGASAGLGGTLCTEKPTTTPALRGGAGGGHGGASSSNSGGGGGGAVALIAMQSITISGNVGAPGGGGQAGDGPTAPNGDGGGGGGGGGAILLEAPSVTITGAITANGGGGGAPFIGDGLRGFMSSATTASGGTYSGPGGTASGGRGGAGLSSPLGGGTYIESDATPVVIITRGAGGGGAAGRIEIRSHVRVTDDATISPPPTTTDATLE